MGAPANKVVMYTTRFCPFCIRARLLLRRRGIDFEDIGIDGNPQLRLEMEEKSGGYTVPQIWIGNQHIGGCTELMALDRTGQLGRVA